MLQQFEEQFTAYIDLLGFKDVVDGIGGKSGISMEKILNLLVYFSNLCADYYGETTGPKDFPTTRIQPAISTFSDHIVISLPLKETITDAKTPEPIMLIFIMTQFTGWLAKIAAEALSVGLLVRGGATIGKLYHKQNIVFGKALVDAYSIESQTSFYPRVVLSDTITSRLTQGGKQTVLLKAEDGLYHVDYFRRLVLGALNPTACRAANINDRIKDFVKIVTDKMTELESKSKLKELAKWVWFAREFRSGLDRESQHLKSLGVSLDAIPWPK